MLSCVVSLWMVVAVGQVAPNEAWLKSVPADTPVVVHFRGMDNVSADLTAMLQAMSPTLAGLGLEQQLQIVPQMLGESVSKSPFLVLVGLPDPAQPAIPAWTAIVKAEYPGLIKTLAADGEKPKSVGGYDSFASKNGETWFASKGAGFVAFGPSEDMIKAIQKPSKNLGQTASAELKAKLLGGDVGIYLNIAKVQETYGDLFEQAKPALLAQLEQANAAQGAKGAENAKVMVDGLTEILKVGDGFVLNLDFDASSLTLSGLATVKADSSAAKSLAKSQSSTGALMDRLPNDLLVFMTLDTSTRTAGSSANALKQAGMPAEKTSPEVEKAVAARMKALEGRQVTGLSLAPMRAISLADPKDPKAAVKASLDASKARQALNEGEATVTPNALSYGGFEFDRVATKIDPKMIEKMKEARPDAPNVDEIFKLILPSSAITEYTGTDGKLFISSAASKDEELKAQIDAIKDKSRTLGSLPSWKALRAKLPKEATAIVVVNAQELTKMALKMVSAMDNVERKPAANLPKVPAFLGFSMVNSPKGYDFKLVVPSEVGPVLEKGFAPIGAGQ